MDLLKLRSINMAIIIFFLGKIILKPFFILFSALFAFASLAEIIIIYLISAVIYSYLK